MMTTPNATPPRDAKKARVYRRTETAQTTGVAECGKYDMLLVAARSLQQDPLMVSLMPLLQRVPPATPGNFPLS
jgi:hypothetical protein